MLAVSKSKKFIYIYIYSAETNCMCKGGTYKGTRSFLEKPKVYVKEEHIFCGNQLYISRGKGCFYNSYRMCQEGT